MQQLSSQPDASRSQQLNNVVSLLEVIASQIETALQETDAPAATLVQAVHSLGGASKVELF